MPIKLKGLSKGFRAFASFTTGQKVVTVVAAVGLVLGAVLFTMLSGGSSGTAPLFTSLSAADASAISKKLDTDGVKYSYAQGGTTILVPQAQVDSLRIEMEGAGLPANDAVGGYSVLKSLPMTASTQVQQMALQQAVEGELTKTIESIDGVQMAIVHLALPQKDVFSDDTSKATASVLVKTQPGTTLSQEQVRAITNLTASSVQGLQPSDVTVTDSTGAVLSSGSATDQAGSQRDQATQSYETREEQSLQTMLDNVVGKGHAVVQVSADLNYDNVKSETKTYLQPSPSAPPLSQSTTTERYAGNGTTVVGVLGPDNSAVPAPSGTASAGGYYKGTNTQDNAYGSNVTDTQQAPGSVRQEHVAVLLDTATAGTVNPTDVQNLVSNAVGLDPKRGDTIQVTRMAFNNAAANQAKQELSAAAKAQAKATQLKLAKTGGLVLFLLLLVLFTWLRSKKARRSQIDPVELARLEELERRNAQLELEASRQAAALENNERLALPGSPEPDPTAEELSRMRDDIGDLVEKQPEEVAQLLRGWLADRRS